MQHTFTVGDRVKLVREVDRFPDFRVAAGLSGTVCRVGAMILAVKMDETIAGCEEWNNEVQWYDDYRDAVAGDLALI